MTPPATIRADRRRMFTLLGEAGGPAAPAGRKSNRQPLAPARVVTCPLLTRATPTAMMTHAATGHHMTGDRFRRAFLLILVVAISIAFIAMLRPFLLTILMAAIFAGLAYPLYQRLAVGLGGHR